MNKEQFKDIISRYTKTMIDKWFDTNSILDVICKSMASTFIKANIDKYDSYLEYFCDKNGKVCVDDFIDNLIDNFTPYNIDLTKFNIPILPNKILLIGKQDLLLFKNMCSEQDCYGNT